jgi:hypothetical protein
MWRLFVPLKYLLIRHPEKIKFDLVFPIVFACLFLLPTFSPEFRQSAITNMDLLGRSSDLLSILTGFFVAALAAVATFGGEEMNETMPGTSPVTLRDPYRSEPETLSRRRFLSFLFGYLAFLSLTLYLAGFVYYGLHTYVIMKYEPDWAVKSFVVFWGLYGIALGNLLANTLLGLFYLTDRIHRPNRKIYRKSDNVVPDTSPDKHAA